jgi:hypothetical protein
MVKNIGSKTIAYISIYKRHQLRTLSFLFYTISIYILKIYKFSFQRFNKTTLLVVHRTKNIISRHCPFNVRIDIKGACVFYVYTQYGGGL